MVENRIYDYARVSSLEQNLDRQIDALKDLGIAERNIKTDKASGKDFNRKAYLSLVGTPQTEPLLRQRNLLVILSLDRLDRHYTEIREQLDYINHTLKADIKVIDMPLLDTRNANDSLDKKFIADLVLQILSYVSEKERQSIKTRQAQGIKSAKDKGKRFGRPKAKYPDNWQDTYSQWKAGEITAVAAMKKLSLKRTTFYNLVKQYEEHRAK